MYKQNTTSNECSDQISAESDGLIGSYGIADRDPKRGDINFLSIGPLASSAITISLEGCRIVEAVNTRAVGQTKLRVAQNDRTIVWSFKSGHYRRYMVVKTKKRRCVTI